MHTTIFSSSLLSSIKLYRAGQQTARLLDVPKVFRRSTLVVTKGSKLSKNANIQPGFEGKKKFLISSFGDTFLTLFPKVNIKVFPFLLVKYIRWQKSRESFLRFYVWTTTKCDNKSISLIKMSNKSHSPLRYFFPTCSSILQIWIEKIQFSITQQSPRLVITKSLDSAGK